MKALTVSNGEKVGRLKKDIYKEFIMWTAMPHAEKVRLGIEDQNQFIEYYKIGINAPARWKQRPDFEQRVDAILKMWSTDKTPDVVHAIYKAAIKGNPMSQLLWLQYFKKFSPKQEVDHNVKVEISAHDIRFLIESLPEPLRSKHYGYFRELFTDANALRNAGQLPDRDIPAEPEDGVRDETDNYASGLSEPPGDEVAASNPPGLRCDMVGELHPHNYKGTAWWG